MVHFLVRSSHIHIPSPWCDELYQQRYLGMLCYSNVASQELKALQRCINHDIALISLKGCTRTLCFFQILTTICSMQLETWFVGPHDLSERSTVQSLFSCANCSLFLLLIADRNGVLTGLWLPYPIRCSVRWTYRSELFQRIRSKLILATISSPNNLKQMFFNI